MQELQEDIILAFRRGDENAFVAIYRHFYQTIFTFCKCLVPVTEAEDIASETFLRLWKTRDRWNTIVNVRAFVYMTARNICYDFLRSQKSKTKKEKEIAYLMGNTDDHILYSEIEAEVVREIKNEIENLPQKWKEIFHMSFFEGKQNSEIAKELSLSDQTVRNLKSLALKTIKANIFIKGFYSSVLVYLIRVINRFI